MEKTTRMRFDDNTSDMGIHIALHQKFLTVIYKIDKNCERLKSHTQNVERCKAEE